MKIAPHILGLAIACIVTPALAKPAYVVSTVNLRAAPGTGSEIVAKIPGGSLVDASACDGGWCEIAWQDKKGYAIQTALDMSGRVPHNAPPPQVPPPASSATSGRGRRPRICRRTGLLRSAAARGLYGRRTTALTGAGAGIGGDDYFVWLPLPNISPVSTA
jgi:hypothetical protein